MSALGRSKEGVELKELPFTKTKIQAAAVKMISGYARHNMLFGGSRSGKTFIACFAIIVRASKVKSRHVMLRHTFNSIKTSIWMDTLPKVIALAFPELMDSWKDRNKSDFVWTLPNGSEIWIGGLDDDKRVEKILGKEFSTIYFNECSQLSYSPIQVALTRLAEKNTLKKKVYYDCNPPSKKHWTYWLFIKKVNPVESEPLENAENYASILMNPADNLENIDEEYLEFLKGLPEKEQARFLRGEFTDGDDGIAYYEFDQELHVHPVEKQPHGTVLIGMDFNVMPMTAVVASYVNGELHIFDEAYLENSDTPKMSHHLRAKGYHGNVYPDSTGKNRKTSGKTDHDILRQDGFSVKFVNNPLQQDRVNNINRLFKENKIKINPRCKKLINDLNKVSWKDNKLDQKTDTNLTHISDALGYLTWNVMPFFSAPARRTHSTNR